MKFPSLDRCRISCITLVLFAVIIPHARGTNYQFTTLPGGGSLNGPNGIAIDSSGNLYIAESSNFTIRKLTPGGILSTFAGIIGSPGDADGAGANARFDFDQDVACDTLGNVYVADTGNNTIRKISPAGLVTTLAGVSGGGSGGGSGSSDGTGAAASFFLPYNLTVDNAGNIYVADTFNYTIRKISPAGVVTTLAGSAGVPGSSDGTGSAARFNKPRGIAVDSSGTIYVADSANHIIRKVSQAGVVTTLAGSAGQFGNVDATGINARFAFPHGVAVDSDQNVYVADTSNNEIRKITPAGVVTTIGGTAGPGNADGVGSAALFTSPDSIVVDGAGIIYVADTGNNSVRKGIKVAEVSTVASSKVLGDFDGDHKTDLVWSNTITGERSMWFLNGNTASGGASLGIVPADWVVSATADFDGDGKADIFWTNTVTGDRAIWLMNGSAMRTNTFMGTVPVDWVISGTGDFNGDGKADLVWTNTTTGDRAMWLLNGSNVLGGGYLGTVPVEWSISGVGDFNGDGKADLVWSNTATGERSMWFQNGSTTIAGATLNTVPVAWVISGVGDFNGDGKADIFLTNTLTGDRAMWLMNGSTIATNAFMGTVPVAWSVSGTGDFNDDGKKDIFWTNTETGDRAMWLLNGVTVTGGGFMGTVPVEWKIN